METEYTVTTVMNDNFCEARKSDRDEWRICPRCQGKGLAGNGNVCSYCFGRGTIRRRDKN